MAKLHNGFKEKISLAAWIREALSDSEKSGPCVALACMHIVGASEVAVDNVKISPGTWTEQQLEQRFLGKAEVESQALDGVQLFRMLAFYEGSNEPLARFHFRVNGELDSADGLNSESSDPKGMFAQGMRHLEAMTQLTFRKDAMLFEASQSMLSMMANSQVQMANKNMEYLDAITRLVTQIATGQSQGRIEEMKVHAQLREREMLVGLAPHFANAIAGKEIIPQAGLDTQIINAMAENITPEQMQVMVNSGMIPQSMVGILANRMKSHLKAKQDEAMERKRLIENSGDPEAEAAGDVH